VLTQTRPLPVPILGGRAAYFFAPAFHAGDEMSASSASRFTAGASAFFR
jgi:hypothetical protein